MPYILIRKFIVYLALTAMIAVFYTIVIFISKNWLWAFAASIIIALGFEPAYHFLSKIADKIFFKNQYDFEKTLSQINKELTTIIKLDDLFNILSKSLTTTLQVKSVSLFVKDAAGNYMQHLLPADLKKNIRAKIIKKDSSLILNLAAAKKPLPIKELEKHQWALVIPLILKNKLSGLLCLGPKMSGDAFSNTDLQLLNTLSSQTAIALENASVYEKERKLSEAKSEFISAASHRLRTPLSVTKWALCLLNEDKQNLNPKQSELIDKALISNEIMTKLANDLLSVAHIEEKKAAANYLPSNIENLINAIIAECQPDIIAKELSIDFEKTAEPLPQASIDYNQIKIAFANIIRNAIIYTPKKGRITVSLKLVDDNQSILFSVQDTGIGIDQPDQEQIFDKFFRSAKAISCHPNGTGLGLFIAKLIIKQHKGKIWFKSAPDKGATFFAKIKI